MLFRSKGDDTLYGDGRVIVDSHGVGTSGPIVTYRDVADLPTPEASGNDTLDGGKGADRLTGGDGSDHFLHHSLTDGKDTIADFHTGAGGDVLDIHDMLVGFSAGHEDEFVQCVTAGGNTTVRVDADGALNGSKFTDICVLTGIATDLTTLVSDGNLALT